MNKTKEEFRQAMREQGLVFDGEMIADGAYQRFKQQDDKSSSQPCWYILTINTNCAYGGFGCFKRSIKSKFFYNGKSSAINPNDSKQSSLQVDHKKIVYAERAKDAQTFLDSVTISTEHEYLKAKKISLKKIPTCDQFNYKTGDWLIVPILNLDHKIISLQGILPDGTKRFFTGASTEGAYVCGDLLQTKTAYLCEGYATGATIYAISDNTPVVCCLSCHTLKKLAPQYKKKYPKINWIIAADNDSRNKLNAGLKTAEELSEILELPYTYPVFENDDQGTDFNDYYMLYEREKTLNRLNVLHHKEMSDEKRIAVLAALSELDYEKQRKKAAKKIGIRLGALDDSVQEERQKNTQKITPFNEEYKIGVEPWTSAVDGRDLANCMYELFLTHTVLPKHAEVILTLWAVATYGFDSFSIFPFLCLTSPEKRCGKTTTMSLLNALVNKALFASNITPSAIFRAIELWQPTLLIDEADTFLNDNDELRGVVNSGHTKEGAYVIRVEGDSNNREPKRFSTWAPKAISMIKMPPDTIVDRSIVVQLKRKLTTDTVTPLPRLFKKNCINIRRKCQRWINDHKQLLADTTITVPTTGNDRANQNWQPLFVIAKLLGDEWVEKAKKAIQAFGCRSDDTEVVSVKLLQDIQHIFKDSITEKFHSKDLINELLAIEESGWCDYRRGKGLDSRGLAKLLKPYEIKSKQIKIDGVNKHGYEHSAFCDAFQRYLPIVEPTNLDATAPFPPDRKGFHPNSEILTNAT